jgi:hypothetical protein
MSQPKAIEKEGEFDYSLTHRLYQLLSNSYSLYNQQIILKVLKKNQKQKEKLLKNRKNRGLF